MTFMSFISGRSVTIHAENFTIDESVGIPWGPDVLYATTPDGMDFELTDAEIERFTEQAAYCTPNEVDR